MLGRALRAGIPMEKLLLGSSELATTTEHAANDKGISCRESQREGREGQNHEMKDPCFILYFPYIYFTYTYRKLVFDTHAWIGM